MKLKDLQNSNLARNSFWAVFGNGLGNGLLLLAGILIARQLGKEVYGEYSIVKTTMMTSASFATFGLGITSTKFLSEYLHNKRQYAFSILRDSQRITFFFSLSIAILISITAPWIADYMQQPDLVTALRALSGIIVIKALVTTQQGILAGLYSFRAIGINSIISGCSMLLLSAPLTYWWDLQGALCALLLSQFIALLLNQLSIQKEKRSDTFRGEQVRQSFTKELLRFSFPIALQESSFSICSWFGILLLSRYATVGDVGVFTTSLQWNVIIMLIPSLLANVVLAHLSGTNHDGQAHRRTLHQLLFINIICTIIPFAVIYPLSGWISSLYGSDFDSMRIVLRILLFDALLFSITTTFKSEYIAKGHNWLLFSIRAIKDILLVVLAYLLLTHSHIETGAICYAIAYISSSIVYLVLTVFLYFVFRMHRTTA